MAGAWLFFSAYQEGAKLEMKRFIRSNPGSFNIVQFRMTLQNSSCVHIEDNGDEISYNDVVYDVISQKTVAGVVVLGVIKDVNETALIDAYDNLVTTQYSQSSSSKSLGQHRFSKRIYEDVKFDVSFNQACCYVWCPQNGVKKVFFYNLGTEVVVPPPKSIFNSQYSDFSAKFEA